MAAGDKPYRVYKGGRARGKVPLPSRPGLDEAPPQRTGGDGRERAPRPGRQIGWKRVLLFTAGALLILFVAWGAASYLALRSGVAAANRRLPTSAKAELVKQGGLLLTHPTTILLLGTDHNDTLARAADHHSDSIMLVHTDPGRHRIAYLSIPRDLRVEIPGYGNGKINSAMQLGGPALALKTVSQFTGLPINHVAVVDLASFKDLIDTLGGVTVNVPERILSNRFDCPFKTIARCDQWRGWAFAKGPQHMTGQRAVVYSRIRENQLNPADSDITRGGRQQAVLQAVAGKLASVGTAVRLPFIGGDLLKPLATDLSAGQFLQLGWVKFRAPSGQVLHCRLGGSASSIGGESVIVSTEENFAVVRMVTGDSAPQPPPPGSGLYGPGCVIGSQTFK